MLHTGKPSYPYTVTCVESTSSTTTTKNPHNTPVLSFLPILKGRGQSRWCWEHYTLGNILVLSPPAGMLETDLALQTSPPLPAGNKSCGFRVGEWIHIQLGIYGDFMDPTNASLPPFSGNCTIPAVHSLHSIAFFQGSTSNCFFTDTGFCKE